MKKRIISILLLCLFIFIQLTSIAYADEHPLAVSDRITTELALLQRRKDDIAATRSALQSASKAQVAYGKSTNKTNDFSFYLNRKILTKKEFEAFKWSFVFSQFARPLQDCLLDVFSQDFFNEMISQNFDINSVRDSIINGLFSSTTDDSLNDNAQNMDNDLNVMMLESINFNDLVDVITQNYAVYALHDENGSDVFLNALLEGSFGLYQPFYIYDTTIEDISSSQVNMLNGLYYNQSLIGNTSFSSNLPGSEQVKEISVPVAFYDASFFMYAQMALSAYFKSNLEYKDITSLESYLGSCQLAIDTFGNICVLAAGPKAVILVPNFGNSALMNVLSTPEDNSRYDNSAEINNSKILDSRINMFNSWVTAQYSRTARSGTSIYPSQYHASLYNSSSHINTYLKNVNNAISNTYVLVENPLIDIQNIYTKRIIATSKSKNSVFNNSLSFRDLTYSVGSTSSSYYSHATRNFLWWSLPVNETIACTVLSPFNNKLSHTGNATIVIANKSNPLATSLVDNGTFAPFIAYQGSDVKTYENKYPLLQYNTTPVNVGASDTNTTYGKKTVFYVAGESLKYAKWTYCHSSRTQDKTIYPISTYFSSAISDTENDMAALSSINDCVSLICNLPEEQLIKDSRFIRYLGAISNGISCSYMFLPKESIDLGQSMSAYKQSDEKGMFLTEYNVFFGDNAKSYKEFMNRGISQFTDKIVNDSTINEVKFNNGLYIPANCSINLSPDEENKAAFSEKLQDSFKNSDFWSSVYNWASKANNGKDSTNIISNIMVAYIIQTDHFDFDGKYLNTTYKSNCTDAGDFPSKLALDEDESIYAFAYYNGTYNEQPKIENLSSDNPSITFLKNLQNTASIKNEDVIKALMCCISGALNTNVSNDTTDITVFESAMMEICNWFDFDYNAVYNALINCGYQSGLDGNNDGHPNDFFFDEYVYTLRNISSLAETIGCNNKNDFATTTYFWDRYYLVNSAFNNVLTSYVRDGFYNQLKSQIDDYHEYLETTFQTSLQYPFNKYVEDNPTKFKTSNSTPQGEPCYLPYTMEYALQTTSFDDWKISNPVKAAADVNDDGDYLAFYDYLDMDTIILHPFGWDDYKYNIYLYSGLGTNLPAMSKSASAFKALIEEARTSQTINPIQLIMSLQKNTNEHKNTLNYTYTRSETKSTITKEELMESAGEFFRHPVTTLSYIITGFLYKVHAAVALGDLGSVFSINFLLESGIYKWIIYHYAAIVSIAIAVVLFIKLIQFAMNHSNNFAQFGRTCVGIIAMCLVPLIVFNSFVWAFDKTSHWALKGSTDKILLSQIDAFTGYEGSDGNIEAEQAVFREQFDNLHGNYSCLQIQQMSSFTPGLEPNYDIVSLQDYTDSVRYNAGIEKWYGSSNTQFDFKSVHSSLYSKSYFYFFYDYIKSEFYDYCCTHSSNSSTQAVSNCVSQLLFSDASGNTDQTENGKHINEIENSFRTLQGNFRQMLLDTDFTYGDSIIETNISKYGGPQVKDLVGLYLIFDNNSYVPNTDDYALQTLLQDTVYYRAFRSSDVMTVHKDSLDPCVWTDNAQIDKYVQERIEQHKGIRSSREGSDSEYPIFTSRLDAYNSTLNSAASDTDAHLVYSSPILTPLEETLCQVTEDIYDTTLKALNYLPGQIHDEAAITLMAFIANFKLNEAFGYEPVAPLEESIYLDNVVRTAFVTDLSEVSSNTNALYAMVAQGDSIGKVTLVVVLEIIITVASVARILIIIYITVASFIILMLRLLHKAPETNDLVYGIVGNILALLILHAITLFLVVVAVEWVANATSSIPNIVLDILMVAFIIIVSIALFKLCKNLIRDAAHLGGAKFKALTHKIGDAVMNISGNIVSKFGRADTQVDKVTVNTLSTALNQASSQNDESRATREARTRAILQRIVEIESESPRTRVNHLAATEGNHMNYDNMHITQIAQRIKEIEQDTHN